jgi:hypothetical protein
MVTAGKDITVCCSAKQCTMHIIQAQYYTVQYNTVQHAFGRQAVCCQQLA